MKAAIVQGARQAPASGGFDVPVPSEGEALVRVTAAVSHVAKAHASGAHYSAGDRHLRAAAPNGFRIAFKPAPFSDFDRAWTENVGFRRTVFAGAGEA